MNMPPLELHESVLNFIRTARIGHLSTVDSTGIPTLLPVCFVTDGKAVFVVVDDMPKNSEPFKMQQIENLERNPNMSFGIDRYDEDWNRLGWVLLRGLGEAHKGQSTEQRNAVSMLRDKYEQYRGMNLSKAPIIRMNILGARHWGQLS